jgi:hypothetical protein
MAARCVCLCLKTAMSKTVTQYLPVVAAGLILAALAGFGRLEVVRVGAPEFMARAKRAIEALPMKVGNWEAAREQLNVRAADLLKPNAESTLLYTYKGGPGGSGRGMQAYYTVIQTDDAAFMTGHAPMNCYPGNGYQTLKQVDRTWRLGEFEIKGTEYVFQQPQLDGSVRVLNVRNFFIFPDGTFGSSLAALDAAASDYRKVKYGVTQVQLVTPGRGLSERQQDEIFSTLVGSERSLEMIRILRTGIPK